MNIGRMTATLSPPPNPGKLVELFYRWENWIPERLSNLPKLTQLVNGSSGVCPRLVSSQIPCPFTPINKRDSETRGAPRRQELVRAAGVCSEGSTCVWDIVSGQTFHHQKKQLIANLLSSNFSPSFSWNRLERWANSADVSDEMLSGVGGRWHHQEPQPPPLPTDPCGTQILGLRLESVFKLLDGVYQLMSQYAKFLYLFNNSISADGMSIHPFHTMWSPQLLNTVPGHCWMTSFPASIGLPAHALVERKAHSPGIALGNLGQQELITQLDRSTFFFSCNWL